MKEELAVTWQQPGAYQAYRSTLEAIPEVRRLYGRKGRYVYYDRLTVDEVRVILQATDSLAHALVAQ